MGQQAARSDHAAAAERVEPLRGKKEAQTLLTRWSVDSLHHALTLSGARVSIELHRTRVPTASVAPYQTTRKKTTAFVTLTERQRNFLNADLPDRRNGLVTLCLKSQNLTVLAAPSHQVVAPMGRERGVVKASPTPIL